MENKINIAELLKDCPSGMELDCTVYDNVTLGCTMDGNCYPIQIQTPEGNMLLSKYGCMSISTHSKCVIFPKGKTTWEGFVPPCKFEDGDIMATDSGMWVGIVKKLSNRDVYEDVYEVYVGVNTNNTNSLKYCNLSFSRLATEEEMQKLFDAIKANGYKWNEKTKTLEKLVKPRFKVGDRIKAICNHFQYDIKELTDTHYTLEEVDYKFKYTEPISEDKNWELVSNKFDINTLKPFDKVLVRCSSLEKWHIQFFEKYNTELGAKYPFICLCYNKYSQCIPYENNQHLLDTANDCNDFYKTWE